jgi:hypothetical protein
MSFHIFTLHRDVVTSWRIIMLRIRLGLWKD